MPKPNWLQQNFDPEAFRKWQIDEQSAKTRRDEGLNAVFGPTNSQFAPKPPSPTQAMDKYPAYVVRWDKNSIGFSDVACGCEYANSKYVYINYDGDEHNYGSSSVAAECHHEPDAYRIVPYALIEELILNGGQIDDPSKMAQLKKKYPGLSFEAWNALPEPDES